MLNSLLWRCSKECFNLLLYLLVLTELWYVLETCIGRVCWCRLLPSRAVPLPWGL